MDFEQHINNTDIRYTSIGTTQLAITACGTDINMSYSIEMKKRKFERILESLTDSTSATAKSTLNSRNNPITASTTTASDLAKRRRITPTSLSNSNSTSSTSLSAHYLPSSRSAFLDRLETYRNVTKWHIPSTSVINSAAWAKRGWICQDTDTVLCPSCKEKVYINLDVQEHSSADYDGQLPSEPTQDEEETDALTLVNAVYEGLIQRYHEMIVTCHKEGCPWRRRGCDDSIQRIEGLLNVSGAISSLQSRYETIVEIEDIPAVAPLPPLTSFVIHEEDITALAFSNHKHLDRNAVVLAACGWQKKDADVVECRHCFRSLGLWLYRGDDPTMEHLDAIDSHLEYCPWRSVHNQDTEISTGKNHEKQKVPGWLLVYLAIQKDNLKRTGPGSQSQPRPRTPLTGSGLDHETDEAADIGQTPELREKKLKDLLRRIREIRKPFNVKSLLRKKDKTHIIQR